LVVGVPAFALPICFFFFFLGSKVVSKVEIAML